MRKIRNEGGTWVEYKVPDNKVIIKTVMDVEGKGN